MTTDGPAAPAKPGRQKPRKLDIEIRLSGEGSGHPAQPVPVAPHGQRGSQKKNSPALAFPQTKATPPGPGFDARLRFEKKGRGGQPVLIVFSVLPEALRRAGVESLEALGRRLRESLACGGTVAGGDLVLQYRDRERV